MAYLSSNTPLARFENEQYVLEKMRTGEGNDVSFNEERKNELQEEMRGQGRDTDSGRDK